MEHLGPFGHHPDLSCDYCVEVEALEGMAVDVKLGLRSQWPFWTRLSALLHHTRLGLMPDDEFTRRAREIVPQLEGRVLP